VIDLAGAPPGERAELRKVLVDASVRGFREGIGIGAALVILGGLLSLVGIRDPRTRVPAERCPAGALASAGAEATLEAPLEAPLAGVAPESE
jgi:hypothetical protein